MAPRVLVALASMAVAMVALSDEKQSTEGKTGESIFSGDDLSGWIGHGADATNWEAVDGELRSQGGSDGVRMLITERDYRDFELWLEFNAPKNTNTGVFFRFPAEAKGRPAYVGNEIQIVDENSERYTEKMTADRRMGAHYAVAAPCAEPPPLRPGEWQTFRLRCVGSQLKVWIDDVLVQDVDMADYPEELKKEHSGLLQTSGRIGLQSKDVPVRFRHLRINEISSAEKSE